MRLHVVSLPHTRTSKDFPSCAFTQKVLKFCKMMYNLGHTVIHYGAEGSEVICSEHVQIISSEEQKEFFGDISKSYSSRLVWDPAKPYWQLCNARAAAEINKRLEKKDFVCYVGGGCHKPLHDMLDKSLCIGVEPFIGYYGTFADFCVYETYTHQASVYGTKSTDPNGRLYDAVIPNYYDMEDFPLCNPGGGEYLFYIGRMIQRKGLLIAVETARATGIPLKMAGQGVVEDTAEFIRTEEGQQFQKDGLIEYVGEVGFEERARLMTCAKAVIMPTVFMEPFGGVSAEAQLCGTPVISTDYASFRETVEHGKTGYRCHTLDHFSWAAKNVHTLDNNYIRNRAINKWSIETVGPMFEEYFDMLLGLWGTGWNTSNRNRTDLRWLNSSNW